jgi:uncharacterized membrane protein YheB (UPF0754 family)
MASWLILLLLFPVICAVIGYVTNVVAVKMIFRPHEKRRVGPIVLQGVLPKHQRHFARLLSKIITNEFLNTSDLVEALNRPAVLDRLEAAVREIAPALVEELRAFVPEAQRALLTDQTVTMVVDRLASEARTRLPELIPTLKERAADALDLRALITEKVVGWGARGLEEVIYDVSKKELDFIEYYGGIFGFFLGLLQWLVLQVAGNIALPLVGCVVGCVTNWLAIQMLFYPREPRKYLGLFTYQGMFPKGQKRMAAKMGTIAARELLIPKEIFGELADRLVPSEIKSSDVEQVEMALRAEVGPLFQMVDGMVPEDQRGALREQIARRLTQESPAWRAAMVRTATESVDIDRMLTTRVETLQKSEFEQLIRGLFEREEIYLIIYGGLLGALIGALQLALVGWVG